MVTAEHTNPGKRIGRRAPEKKEPQTQVQRYPMPEKRSDKVLDNWRESDLIRFIRLETNDLDEVDTYINMVNILGADVPPTSFKEVQQNIDEEKSKFRERLGAINWPFLMKDVAFILSSIQEPSRKIMRMLAEGDVDPKAIKELNTSIQQMGFVPYIHWNNRDDYPLTIGFEFFKNISSDGPDIFKMSEIMGKALTSVALFDLLGILKRFNRHTQESPFAICPTCDRVFQRTRKDRSFCSRQCLDSFRNKKFSDSQVSDT